MSSFKIIDRTLGHDVNEEEAYDHELYGECDAPAWYGSRADAEEIASALKECTGHDFVIRRY